MPKMASSRALLHDTNVLKIVGARKTTKRLRLWTSLATMFETQVSDLASFQEPGPGSWRSAGDPVVEGTPIFSITLF